MMKYLGIVFVLAGCAAIEPLAKSALDAIAPAAVDMLTDAVADRWGSDAEPEDPGCFPASDAVADSFGDDDREYVYVVCRATAR